MGDRKRESTGFLIKQRAFIKMYLITNIENGKWYGMQLLDEMKIRIDNFVNEINEKDILLIMAIKKKLKRFVPTLMH